VIIIVNICLYFPSNQKTLWETNVVMELILDIYTAFWQEILFFFTFFFIKNTYTFNASLNIVIHAVIHAFFCAIQKYVYPVLDSLLYYSNCLFFYKLALRNGCPWKAWVKVITSLPSTTCDIVSQNMFVLSFCGLKAEFTL